MKLFTADFFGETQFGSAFLRLALSVALCFAFLFEARADAPAPGTNRFLFVVDTSISMKKLEEPLRETVFDLIYSGVRGQMTNGDTFGVWFVGSTNDTSMGVETWKTKFAVESAARIALRLKDQGFKGKPALDTAISDLQHVAEVVNDVTVVISSGGDTPILGTPFDDAINARIQELAPAMRRTKAIFNIVLGVQDGKFAAWAVNSPDFLVSVPALPPRAVKPPPVVAKSKPVLETNAAPVQTKRAEAKPKPSSPPIIITKETVDREKQMVRALASTESANVQIGSHAATNAPVVATNVSSAIVPTNPPVARSNAPVATPVPPVTPKPPVAEAVAAVKTNSTEALPVAMVKPEVVKPEPISTTNAALVVESKATPPPVQPEVQSGAGSSKLLWAAAGALGAVALIAAIMLVRRARALEPSLISQVAAMERMQR